MEAALTLSWSISIKIGARSSCIPCRRLVVVVVRFTSKSEMKR